MPDVKDTTIATVRRARASLPGGLSTPLALCIDELAAGIDRVIADRAALLAALKALGRPDRDGHCYDQCRIYGHLRHTPKCEAARAIIAKTEARS